MAVELLARTYERGQVKNMTSLEVVEIKLPSLSKISVCNNQKSSVLFHGYSWNREIPK